MEAYLQITTRCNMMCPHCMFSCEPGKGEDMSIDTFKAAIQFLLDGEHTCFIGGGEPTLHPEFWSMLGHVMRVNAWYAGETSGPAIGLVTNGTDTDTTLRLLELAKTGAVYIRLSRAYHDLSMVSDSVIDAFERISKHYDFVAQDSKDYDVQGTGRGSKYMGGFKTVCNNPQPVIAPDGDIYRCECKEEIIGNVFTGLKIEPDEDNSYGCTYALRNEDD